MKDLIAKCRYYKGEDECPESLFEKNVSSNWTYEKIWVQNDDMRDENNFNMLGYLDNGLKDFNADDGTPITLKALLYNRHTHWCGGYGVDVDVANFKEWYLTTYYIKIEY